MNDGSDNGLDQRTGKVKDATIKTTPAGPDGPPYFEFGFLTTANENGVFYINLDATDGVFMAGLVMAAYAKGAALEIIFTPKERAVDPGGFVRGARLLDK